MFWFWTSIWGRPSVPSWELQHQAPFVWIYWLGFWDGYLWILQWRHDWKNILSFQNRIVEYLLSRLTLTGQGPPGQTADARPSTPLYRMGWMIPHHQAPGHHSPLSEHWPTRTRPFTANFTKYSDSEGSDACFALALMWRMLFQPNQPPPPPPSQWYLIWLTIPLVQTLMLIYRYR